MSTPFTHSELGIYNRIVGPALLECRDPNDGQSSDPRSKSRHQYTAVNGILLKRHLPPKGAGDRWRGERRPPSWESIDIPAHWPLLTAWLQSIWGDTPRPWSMGGATAYGDAGRPVSMVWMRSRIEIVGTDWPQQLACPHCCGWIVWAEAGYVPGYRICQQCHLHWRIDFRAEGPYGSSHRPWTLRPVVRDRQYVRSWPYGDLG